ncbi:MAG: arginine deiminase family protein [Flavobacteriales bacterium]|tara:strand:- start:6581 stop:7492 length:912 start_codon:yes stop_codon:yes gene_type:complete
MRLNIHNETATLKTVVFGIPDSFGGTPNLQDCYDPKSKIYVASGEFPTQDDITLEMESVADVFFKYNVEVLRPKNIENLNQIFARDIGFVVGNTFFVPNIIADREEESKAILHILDQIDESDIVRMPSQTRTEGGDVMVHNDYVFVGYSKEEDFNTYTVARTNQAALDFLKENIKAKKVIGFELNKSDQDPYDNALHLDCCFQPVGQNHAIVHQEGFKNKEDINLLKDIFGEENLIFVNKKEMFEMYSNVFSISEKVVVSEKSFTSLNNKLRSLGILVEEVPYSEIAKMEGLLRCSTLPIERL